MTVVRTNDILNGTSGNDTFNPGLGDDQVNGGSGDDLLILDYSVDDTGTGMSLDAAYSYYGAEGYAYRYTATNTTVFLDRIYFKDIDRFAITGTSLDDYINPWNGNDTINAGAGNDTVTNGGGGYDLLDGGTGIDTLLLNFSSYSSNITINNPILGINIPGTVQATNFENFKIYTGSGNDTLIQTGLINGAVYRSNEIFSSGSGNDILNAGLGNDDQVNGGSGDDLLILDYSVDDTGTGMSLDAAYSYYGAEGYAYRYTATNTTVFLDRIYFKDIDRFSITGTSQNDTITTWSGNDSIDAGAGNDRINGGGGDDILTGGTGVDRFVYDTGSTFTSSNLGLDTITDFVINTDKIVLDKTTFTALTSTEGGDLSTSDFATINASTNAALVAGASSARIVFNSFNGDLFYNENGATAGLGSGGLFANLSGLSSLEGSDFVVQA